MKQLPRKVILTMIRDFGVKVGPDTFMQWDGMVGHSGLSNTNDRGLQLLKFTQNNRLTLANKMPP